MANIIQSVLSRLQSAFNSLRTTAQSGLGQFSQMWGMWVREIWPTVDKRTAIDEHYAQNTALFSIVNFDAEKFASIPRYVYDAKQTTSQGIYNKRLSDGPNVQALINLLKKPNPEQSQSEFMELARIFYDCTGDAIIWLNRGDKTEKFVQPYVDSTGNFVPGQFVARTDAELDALPVLEMWVLPSGWVGVIPMENDLFSVKAYWMQVNGKTLVIRKNDIIHWKKQNPVFDPTNGGHLRGINPFEVGRHTIQENKDAVAATDRMFKNDGAKGVLVNENLKWDQLEENQKQELREMIDNRINNAAEVKGSVATLGGKWNYFNIAKDSVDKALLEGKKFTWQELCFLIKVPYELFNTETTYANKAEAQKGWVSNTISPACLNFDDKMTERLAPAFSLIDATGNAIVVIRSDISSLPEMKKDTAALITAFQQAWYLSPNQKRVELGFDPDPNPLFDEPWIPDGVRPLSDVIATLEFNQQNQNANEQGITN